MLTFSHGTEGAGARPVPCPWFLQQNLNVAALRYLLGGGVPEKSRNCHLARNELPHFGCFYVLYGVKHRKEF